MDIPNVSGIYGIYNLTNGKCYIGSSKKLRVRWINHRSELRRGVHGNAHLQNSWIKYGEAQFEFRVLHLCSESELGAQEERFMRELRACDRQQGYNLQPIVEARPSMSAETRAKLSAANLGKKRSPETCERIRQAHLGTKFSVAAKQAMSKAHQGKKLTEEHKAKFRGRRHSPETIAKLQANCRGWHHDEATKEHLRQVNLGKTLSPEHRAKLSASHKGHRLSPEHRAKLSVSIRAALARRKAALTTS